MPGRLLKDWVANMGDAGGYDLFPNTEWTLVVLAGNRDIKAQQAALGRLLPRYMQAIVAYLTSVRRMSRDQAEELMQGFLTSKVLEGALMERARRELGSFRGFLVTALDHFVVSQHRYDTAAKRRPESGVSSLLDSQQPRTQENDPARVFDVAWARGLVAETVKRMKKDCMAQDQLHIWGVFEGRVLRVMLEGAPPVPYAELVEKFNLKSPAQACNVLVSGKRRFIGGLKALIYEYEPDEARIEDEIRSLRSILGGAG